MAKYYNNKVKTGRLAGSVFAVRYGETIERAYQPIVANPNTPKQIEARAKLKLMSQLAEVMAPVIPLPRVGSMSSRNRFISGNYAAATYANQQADVNMSAIDLTQSVVAMPAISGAREANSISMYILQTGVIGGADFDRVVYVMFTRQPDAKLRLVTSRVVTEPGPDSQFSTNLPLVTTPVYIYVYGIRDNNEAARVVFGNMEVQTAEAIANLLVQRTLLETDVTLTETRYFYLPAVS